MMKRLLLAVIAAALAVPCAHATPLDVSLQTAPWSFALYNSAGQPTGQTLLPISTDGYQVGISAGPASVSDFATATLTFNAAADSQLSLTDLDADDRMVLELNGNVVAAVGLFGPGLGSMIFTPTGVAQPQEFLDDFSFNNVYGPSNPLVIGGLLGGENTLELIVNKTFGGINGSSLQDGGISLFLAGSVTDASLPVPEPAGWPLLLLGAAGLAAMRQRRRPA